MGLVQLPDRQANGQRGRLAYAAFEVDVCARVRGFLKGEHGIEDVEG
jgi:hypothetical protein